MLSRNKEFQAPGCIVCSSLGEAIEAARAAGETECFIIGGAAVYREAMPQVEKLYLTKVLSHVDGDVFFPEWEGDFEKVSEEPFQADEKNDFPTVFQIWVRKK